MNTKTISGKMVIISILLLIFLVSSASFMVYQRQVVDQMESNFLNKGYPSIILSQRIKFHTVQVQQWLTDISATRALDGLNDGFDEAQNHAVLFRQRLDELAQLSPELGPQLDEISTAFTPYYETGKRMAQGYVEKGPAGGNLIMGEFDGVAGTISERVDTLIEQLQVQVERDRGAYDAAKKQVSITIVVAVLGLLSIFAYFSVVLRNMIRALKEISVEFTLLGQGNFITRVRAIDKREDELGEMGRNISTMKHQLRDMIAEIGDAAGQLNGCIHSMGDVTNRTMLSVQQQQMETEQVASAVTEMSANSREVAENASMAAESARGADHSAKNGNSVVQETVSSIESLAASVSSAADAIHKLESDSESVGTILEVIRSIADQTNLLALNAAIEAARAGEQGRGFAVVADEVRTLASRTQDATGDIQKMIEQLQGGAAHAVSEMVTGSTKTRESVGLVQSASKNLNEIMAAVKTISDMSTQIAASAEEQSTVAEEVSRNTNNISMENTRNSVSVQEIVNSTEELAGLSQRLDSAVSSFRIR